MLYFLLVKIFNTGLGQRRLFYFALGWGKILILIYDYMICTFTSIGIPVPIVAIAAGAAHDQYGHDDL